MKGLDETVTSKHMASFKGSALSLLLPVGHGQPVHPGQSHGQGEGGGSGFVPSPSGGQEYILGAPNSPCALPQGSSLRGPKSEAPRGRAEFRAALDLGGHKHAQFPCCHSYGTEMLSFLL